MKNQNTIFIAIACALAFALAPVTQAAPTPEAYAPVITIHSAGNVLRGKTGSFVLHGYPWYWYSQAHVNFKVSGTAIPGVDYVALVSPAYIGHSGYGVILLKTLPDPRGASDTTAYSVEVTLEPGPGYTVGEPSSAKILISTSCALEACW